ncbi:hypothetical protein QVD99_007502 [Batrachochytrium dendrobatidis]|nr:hypothetical protein QVD99_007502 [Batrachochytrium dendrobatidis]
MPFEPQFSWESTDMVLQYRPCGGGEHLASTPVRVVQERTSSNVARSLINDNAIPVYLEPLFMSALDTLISHAHVLEEDAQINLDQPQEELMRHVNEWVDVFARHRAAYSTRVEPVFLKAFQTIVNNPVSSDVFDTLLQLEEEYAQAVKEICQSMNEDIQKLENVQVSEAMQRGVVEGSREFHELAIQQVDDLTMLRATWDSQLEDLYMHQRQEYRDFVVKIYEEMLERANSNAEKLHEQHQLTSFENSIGDMIIFKAINRFEKRPSKEILNIVSKNENMLKQNFNFQPSLPQPALRSENEAIQSSAQPTSFKLKKTNDSEDILHNSPDSIANSLVLQSQNDNCYTETAELSQSILSPSFDTIPDITVQSQAVDATYTSNAPVIENTQEPAINNAEKELSEMGFELNQIRAALEITEKDTERAIILLLENPRLVREHMRAKETLACEAATRKHADHEVPALRMRGSNSLLNLKGMDKDIPNPLSFLMAASTSQAEVDTTTSVKDQRVELGIRTLNKSRHKSEQSLSGKRSFSFTRQLFQGGQSNSSTDGVYGPFSTSNQDRSNSISKPGALTLNRVGSFFEKAMDAFRMDDEQKVQEPEEAQVDMSESFTIYFGTQVRLMFSVMLQTYCDHTSDLASNSAQELALHAQMCSALYSQSVSGMILLLRSSDFANYSHGTTANKELIQKCKMSTEFHFDSIERQLESISDGLPCDEAGVPILQEGDFFVTKHSNLPSAHVVFHLIYDDSELAMKSDLSSRSPLIAGYRAILQTAQLCNVHNLIIPIFLLPDSQIIQPYPHTTRPSVSTWKPKLPDSILIKRAEVVLRHTKGLLTEQTRLLKHLGGSLSAKVDKYSRSLVFRMPNDLPHVQTVFADIREKLTVVFRTS